MQGSNQGQGRRAFTQLKGNGEFNVAPAVLSSKITDGGEFIVIGRTRQSDQPQVWSTGDQQQTQSLYNQFDKTLQPETT